MNMRPEADGLVSVRGGCHCGAVRYEVSVPSRAVAHRCNCSICAAGGFVQIIVPERQFRLLSGEDVLTEYRFNTGVARHLFCSVCGIKSFYRPRSNPDGVSINVNCIDTSPLERLDIEPFDGQNWEANAASLRHLSEPR